MKKVRIGVLGCGRGNTMIDYCLKNKDVELVAICDFNDYYLSHTVEKLKKHKMPTKVFKNFDDFLECEMDGVVLANYANDHAPFAVRCLDKGINVMSEVLPCENLKEAVELVEAVERSGKVYSYAENYCFFNCTREMKRLYGKGFLGEFMYGEGEYIHNCEGSWAELTKADRNHWRNTKSAFFYCTHSAGPLIHITGLRPVKVQGIEGEYSQKMKDLGAGGASIAVEMVTLSNGGTFKSIHGGGLSESSVWYSMYCSEMEIESGREVPGQRYGALDSIYIKDDRHVPGRKRFFRAYRVKESKAARRAGHGGSDWYTMHNFVAAIRGEEAEIIDVYEALDMFFVGHFGFLSALNKGIVTEIPDFRDPNVRERYRNDTRCCTPDKGREQTLPSNAQGGMQTTDETYERMKEEMERRRREIDEEKMRTSWQWFKIGCKEYFENLFSLRKRIK